jgi:hypothetical protein
MQHQIAFCFGDLGSGFLPLLRGGRFVTVPQMCVADDDERERRSFFLSGLQTARRQDNRTGTDGGC